MLLILGSPLTKQCLEMRYVVLMVLVLVCVTSAAPAVHPRVTVAPRTVARTAVPTNRLTTVEWEAYHEHEHEGPGSYSFGYDVQDEASGNVQFREETRDADGTVRGSYGLLEPDGNVRIVHYIADHLGFRVEIENSLKPDEQHPAPHRVSAASRLRLPFLQSQQRHQQPYDFDVTTFRYPINVI